MIRVIGRMLAIAGCAVTAAPVPPTERRLVVWGWNRAEDLRFLPPGTQVAAYAGTVWLAGDEVRWWPRRFPLRLPAGVMPSAVVHVEIDPRAGVRWTPEVRARAAEAALRLAARPGYRGVQIDFEVRASQRAALVELVGDMRAGLAPGTRLSMTALASWCLHESWLGALPVDEVVPMLFRMGPRGGAVAERLAAGGDFAEPACRRALAVSSDAPVAGWPAGRRVYLFHPRSWTPRAWDAHRGRVG